MSFASFGAWDDSAKAARLVALSAFSLQSQARMHIKPDVSAICCGIYAGS